MIAKSLLCSSFMLLLHPTVAVYQEVLELDVKTFPKVHEPDTVWLVLWYAPWCGHCKKLAPVYEKVAEHFHRQRPQRVSIARVDATAHPALALCFGSRIADFKGPRTFEGLVNFVESELVRPPGAPPLEPPAPEAKTKGNKAKKGSLFGRRSEWRLERGVELLKRTGRSLLTDYDPLTAGLACLGCCLAGAACLVVALCAFTQASDRPPDS